MAFCKNCGKELKKGEKCNCAEVKETKTTSSNGGFDFGKTMTSIKDDLFASIKNPFKVVKDNVEENDMPKTYVLAAIIALTFGIFMAGLFKNIIGLFIELALGAAGGLGSMMNSSKVADMIKVPYVKVIIYGLVIYAISLVAYAVVMLIVPAIIKNKKIDFKKALTLTAAAYIPMIWINVIGAVIGFLGISTTFLLIVYLVGCVIVGYNFAYAYAKITEVEDNKFGYAIAILVIIAGIISGICTYAVANSMSKSIAKDMISDSKVDDLDDLDDLFD